MPVPLSKNSLKVTYLMTSRMKMRGRAQIVPKKKVRFNHKCMNYLHLQVGIIYYLKPPTVNPFTARTAIWRFGLLTYCGIYLTIVLNFPYASYRPVHLS